MNHNDQQSDNFGSSLSEQQSILLEWLGNNPSITEAQAKFLGVDEPQEEFKSLHSLGYEIYMYKYADPNKKLPPVIIFSLKPPKEVMGES